MKNRLFISLNLPDSIIENIIRLRDQICKDEKIKWEPKEKLHLTIKFIGDVSDEVMKNISAILKEAHSDFDLVIKTTCFLKNIEDFSRFNAIYSKFFDKEFPARSAVGVAGLPKNVLIEIEVIAEVKS